MDLIGISRVLDRRLRFVFAVFDHRGVFFFFFAGTFFTRRRIFVTMRIFVRFGKGRRLPAFDPEQGIEVFAEDLRDFRQGEDIREGFASFPLGDCLMRDAEQICQLRLRQAFFFSEFRDLLSDDGSVRHDAPPVRLMVEMYDGEE